MRCGTTSDSHVIRLGILTCERKTTRPKIEWLRDPMVMVFEKTYNMAGSTGLECAHQNVLSGDFPGGQWLILHHPVKGVRVHFLTGKQVRSHALAKKKKSQM